MNNLIILDWDDTLFPTSWTMASGIDITDHNEMKNRLIFSNLDNVLHLLLLKLTSKYDVIIVTNAAEKWIRSSFFVLPNSYKLINKKIKIHSARDLYSSTSIDPFMWKVATFSKVVDEKYNNILSVGDAEYEVAALSNLYSKRKSHERKSNGMNKLLGKTLRFIEYPDYNQLIEQLEIFSENIDKIMRANKLLDISFGPIDDELD